MMEAIHLLSFRVEIESCHRATVGIQSLFLGYVKGTT